MRVVIQRVRRGWVAVSGETVGEIGQGLVVLLGIGPEDTESQADELAAQIADLRIFPDQEGKMNLSLLDVAGQVLVVPQFTLYADTSRGNRPSFTGAAPPSRARELVNLFIRSLAEKGIPTQSGTFGAHMVVSLENDGPVTIALDTEGEW
ncbi:MAG: D-aminoacyl-tRNA deacylase [Anaerolineales bacterium]|nr:D-aminoacyl-tRNA deacylase [Anaerolineales bacterium]